jgi:hypothetical protein
MKATLTFPVPCEIVQLQPADCPMSDELEAALQDLAVRSFADLRWVSLKDLRQLGDTTGALSLELGCLIRRASRGEFGPVGDEAWISPWLADFWWKDGPGEEEAGSGCSAPADARSGDVFSIPKSARGIPVPHLPMSSRLANILCGAGLEFLGGLHRVTSAQLRTLDGCGPVALNELKAIVEAVLEGRLQPRPPPAVEPAPAPPQFRIPQLFHDVSPYRFALSRRLDGVLRRAGIDRLGELDGMEFSRILCMSNCARKTFRELVELIDGLEG